MPDILLDWDEKETFQARPDIPENKKLVADEVNELKDVVNGNALKLPFLLKSTVSGTMVNVKLEGIDVGSIKGQNTFLIKDEDFKKEPEDDTIYDMDGITPLVAFTPEKTYELTPNNTK